MLEQTDLVLIGSEQPPAVASVEALPPESLKLGECLLALTVQGDRHLGVHVPSAHHRLQRVRRLGAVEYNLPREVLFCAVSLCSAGRAA
jgi:hypothetical protein